MFVPRLREPPEAGPDGELHRPTEQCGDAETQPPPHRAVSGGEPLHRVRGLQAVRGGLSAPAQGSFTVPALPRYGAPGNPDPRRGRGSRTESPEFRPGSPSAVQIFPKRLSVWIIITLKLDFL